MPSLLRYPQENGAHGAKKPRYRPKIFPNFTLGMEINYRNKDESNRLQKEAFLRLSPAERFYAFLALSERMSQFPVKERHTKCVNNNFQIVIETNGKPVEGKH